jgi:hypothetical protein
MPYLRNSALILALGVTLPAAQPPTGWNPCGGLKDPAALWQCWGAARGGPEGFLAATCVAKTACPAKDQHGKPVLNCYYESSFSTGFRCILFCNYGGSFPWGTDGGNNCD